MPFAAATHLSRTSLLSFTLHPPHVHVLKKRKKIFLTGKAGAAYTVICSAKYVTLSVSIKPPQTSAQYLNKKSTAEVIF